MHKKIVLASVLTEEDKARKINELIPGGLTHVHYDVMDGSFVEREVLNSSKEIKDIVDSTQKHYVDVHLMVNNPEDILSEVISFADQVSVHYEASFKTSLKEVVAKYKDTNKLGIAINPSTDIEDIKEHIKDLHHIMIMSVVPGKGGQSYIESSVEKIKALKALIEEINPNVLIEIDGGINDITGPKSFNAGVDMAVSGSYLINNFDNGALEAIKKLH